MRGDPEFMKLEIFGLANSDKPEYSFSCTPESLAKDYANGSIVRVGSYDCPFGVLDAFYRMMCECNGRSPSFVRMKCISLTRFPGKFSDHARYGIDVIGAGQPAAPDGVPVEEDVPEDGPM